MSLEVTTFNTQRDFSGAVMGSIDQLVAEHPHSLLCLQEVTHSMRQRLFGIFPRLLFAGENVIIVPQNYEIGTTQELSFGSAEASFLQTEIIVDTARFFLITGKLRHHIFPGAIAERHRVLQRLARLFSEHPTLMALDMNHAFPVESRIAERVLSRYGFGFTLQPGGTHDISRVEHSWKKYFPRFLRRRDIDKIVHSSHFSLQSSHVHPDIKTSDHDPVIGVFVLKGVK